MNWNVYRSKRNFSNFFLYNHPENYSEYSNCNDDEAFLLGLIDEDIKRVHPKKDFIKTLDLESLLTPQYKMLRGIVSAAKTLVNEGSDFNILSNLNFRTNHDLFVYCKKNNAGADIIKKAHQPIPVLVFYQRKTTTPILKEHEAYFPPYCVSLERLLDPVVV